MKKNIFTKSNLWIGIIILVISIFLFFIFRSKLFSMFTVEEIQSFVSSFGIFAPLIYILILTIAIIVSQIPNIPLTITSGIIFGPFLGGIYSLIGGMLGSIACFFISKTLGMSVMKKIFGKTLYFCDRCNDKYIGLVVFITRLFPFFSFDVISYGAGLTNMRFKTFLIATFFGMIPMTFLFTYAGGFVLVDPRIAFILSMILIALFFIVPLLIHKYNFLGLKDRIQFK